MNAVSWKKGFMLSAVWIILFTGISFAATAPQVAFIEKVSLAADSHKCSPTSIAVAPDGKRYVVEGGLSRIAVYSRSGALLRTIPVVNATVSDIEADAAGNLFVANATKKKIEKYDASGAKVAETPAASLGSVNGIGIDAASGSVYAVDPGGYLPGNAKIVVFSNDLAPAGIVIPEASKYPRDVEIGQSEIYVLEMSAAGTSVARIRVLDKTTRTDKAVFGEYGVSDNQLAKPFDFVADGAGRLFVTDSYAKKIVVFDAAARTWLSTIKQFNGGQAQMMNSLYGVALSPEGRMIAVSQAEHALYHFGIDGYGFMQVSPLSLSFASSDPAAQQVTVGNTGAGAITYAATASEEWIALSAGSGTVNAAAAATFSVSVNAAGLAVGAYHGTVAVTSGSGETEIISVSLAVDGSGPAALTVSKSGTGSVNASSGMLVWNGSTATAVYSAGTVVTLTAAPAEGFAFSGWSGDCAGTAPCALTMSGPKTVNALFEAVAAPQTPAASGAARVNLIASSNGTVRTFDASYSMVREFRPFGNRYATDIPLASGDVDGDGVDEIIAGRGAAQNQRSGIAIFDRSGASLAGGEFLAFGPRVRYGVRVAAGDFDGDGIAEIVAGTGPAAENSAEVRIFAVRNGGIIDTGVYVMPFASKYGVNVAAGDVDGDGKAELLVAPGPDPQAQALVKVLKVDTANGMGQWSVFDTGISVSLNSFSGALPAAADLDGDGRTEILVATAPGFDQAGSRVDAFSGTGSAFNFAVIDAAAGGLAVAAGDVDGNGLGDVLLAARQSSRAPLMIRIHSAGVAMTSFEAFSQTLYGADITLGKLGY